jgi:hypothetical protein
MSTASTTTPNSNPNPVNVNTSTPAAAPHPTGSRLIAALEHAWSQIRARHPDVPPVVVITGTGRTGRGHATLGHFCAERWHTDDAERVSELFIAGELLAGNGVHTGGRVTLKTLLHEAAHGVATTRGIKDCSRQNRYHNRAFARLAAELGLAAPESPHPVLGYSVATLEDATAAAWAEVIAAIDAARLPHLGEMFTATAVTTGEPGAVAQSRAGTRFQVACQCPQPRTLSITPRQYETAPLICGACEQTFEPRT